MCIIKRPKGTVLAQALGFEPKRTVLETVMLPITLSLYGARPVTWTQNLPIISRVLWPVELDEQILVPRIGFEPMTNRIWVYCSTTELSRHIVKRTPSKNSSALLYGQAKMLTLCRYPYAMHLLYSAKVFNGTPAGTWTLFSSLKGLRLNQFVFGRI